MKEKLLNATMRSVQKTWLLIVMMLTSLSASAALEWQDLPVGQLNNEPNIFEPETFYKFTPTENGVLTIWSQDVIYHVYSALTEDGSNVDYSTQVSSSAYGSYTEQGVTFSKKTTTNVEGGKTYYLMSGKGFSKGMKFLALLEGEITELKLVSCSQETGKMFNITDERDGQVELEFNLPATADQWAYVKVGTYPLDKENGKVETRQDPNTGRLIFNLKSLLTTWFEEGRYKEGDELTLTITGICAKTNNNIKYGDGTLVLKYTAPAKPHYNTNVIAPNPFLSYWVAGDPDGILTLEFDYPLMTMENGQTAVVSMNMGSADLGDAWQDQLSKDKIRIDGNKLYVDFTGVLRTYEALGLKQKWTSINIKVSYIKMADGTMSFNPNAGNYGSVDLSCTFKEYKSDVAVEFTPANGATLTDDFFKVYFSDKEAFTFSGVRLSYQTQDDIKYEEDVTEGITSVEEGENAIEYTIPVPANVKAGKNIRVSFINGVGNDGLEHNFTVRYNPGPELVGDLLPVSSSIEDNAVVSKLDNITLTFGEAVEYCKQEGDVREAVFYDKSANWKEILAAITISEDGKTVTVTPETPLTDTHEYEMYINYNVIVNKEYIETKGKYGRYMPGKSINFTISSMYDKYIFATDPIAGATLTGLKVVTLTTKPGADSYNEAISSTHDPDHGAWVEDAAGNKVADMKISDITDGMALTLETPITEAGTYNVVLDENTVTYGEGFGQSNNEAKIYIPYTILEKPQAVITVENTDPASESKVESISDITITFSEPVYGDNLYVELYNKANYTTFFGTMTINPKNRTMAVASFDNITEEGTYTLELPEGLVGDETWYQNNGTTGKTNATTILYFTVGNGGGSEASDWTTDPANGSTVTSIKTIHVWNNTVSEMGCGSGKITVKKDGVEIEKIADTSYGIDWNELVITTSQEYTEDGVYTFEAPEGFFVDGSGNALPAVTFTYTIGNGGGSETSDWTTDPADGSTVTSIKTIHVWNNTVSEMGCGSGKITVKKDGVEIEKIADASFGYDLNELVITTSQEYTEDGVYTFEAPEGFFLDGFGNALPAVTFTYIIGTGTGINSVATDIDGASVYSIGGIKMNGKNLRGLYIINGKKTVLKK